MSSSTSSILESMSPSIFIPPKYFPWNGSPPPNLINDTPQMRFEPRKYPWLVEQDHVYPTNLLPLKTSKQHDTYFIGTWGRNDRLVYVQLLSRHEQGELIARLDAHRRPQLRLIVTPWQKGGRRIRGHDYFFLSDWSELKADIGVLRCWYETMERGMSDRHGLHKIKIWDMAHLPEDYELLWAFVAVYLLRVWMKATVYDYQWRV